MSVPSEHPPVSDASSVASDDSQANGGEALETAEDDSSLPVPSGPLRSSLSDSRSGAKRPSFWKRIKMRSRGASTVEPASVSEMAVRLDAIEQTVEHFDTTLQAQLEALNARLEDVWESEEQLSHLAEIQSKLDRLAAAQAKQAQSIDGLQRTLGWLAALVVVAAASIGFLASQLL